MENTNSDIHSCKNTGGKPGKNKMQRKSHGGSTRRNMERDNPTDSDSHAAATRHDPSSGALQVRNGRLRDSEAQMVPLVLSGENKKCMVFEVVL